MTIPQKNDIHLVVGGMDQVAQALGDTGIFASVISISSTSGLREAIAKDAFPKDKTKVIFLFADNLHVDTEQDLEFLVGGLSRAGFYIMLLAVTDAARIIAQRNPAAAIFDGQYTVNTLLGAISGLGLIQIPPLDNGNKSIFETQTQTETIQPLATGSWTPTTQSSEAPNQGWVKPQEIDNSLDHTYNQKAEPVFQTAPERTTPADLNFNTDHAYNVPVDQSVSPVTQNFPEQAPAQPVQRQGFARPSHTATGQSAQFFDQGTQAPVPRAANTMARPYETGGPLATHQDFSPGYGKRSRGKVIVITSPKGGTGKSSLSINLAVYLGLHLRGSSQRVCLIDANFQQADTGKLLNQFTPNIGNILKDQAALTPDRIEEYLIARPNWNTSFLLGPTTPKDASPVHYNGQFYSRILDVLRQRFDYIVIDTPVAEVYHDILRGFALPEADFIVLPIVPAIHTLMNTDAWLRTVTLPKHAGGDGIDPNKIGIVLNQAQDDVDCDEEQVRKELYGWNYIGAIPATKEWLRCVNNGELIATKNYYEINGALASILYASTGLESLIYGLEEQTVQAQEKVGFFKKILKGVK